MKNVLRDKKKCYILALPLEFAIIALNAHLTNANFDPSLPCSNLEGLLKL